MARGGSELGRLGLIRLGLARVYWATRALPSQQVWAAAQPSRSLATMAVRALWLVCMGKLGCSRARVPVLRTARWLHVAAARVPNPFSLRLFFSFFFSFFFSSSSSSLSFFGKLRQQTLPSSPPPSLTTCNELLTLAKWQHLCRRYCCHLHEHQKNTRKQNNNKSSLCNSGRGPSCEFFFHNSRARPWVQLPEFLHEKQTQKCQNH